MGIYKLFAVCHLATFADGKVNPRLVRQADLPPRRCNWRCQFLHLRLRVLFQVLVRYEKLDGASLAPDGRHVKGWPV